MDFIMFQISADKCIITNLYFYLNVLVKKKWSTRLKGICKCVFNFNNNIALTGLPVDFDPEVLYMY